MKFDLKSWGSREDWEFLLRRILRSLSGLSRLILITHIRATELIVTLLVLSVALWLGVLLFFVPPAGVESVQPQALELNTATLDFLFDWKQERERQGGQGLDIPAGTLFP
jgi:hypothetical protein